MRCSVKLIFGIIFLFLTGCAGLQPITDSDRTFERVVEAPGYSKEQIFNGTKIWIAENFKSAKAVLEYENKDTGTIIGNGIISYPCSGLESTFYDASRYQGSEIPYNVQQPAPFMAAFL